MEKGCDYMVKQQKCYIYIRVSTSMQVDGYSLDAQKDKLHKYADYQEMVIAGEYSDEGKSGKSVWIFLCDEIALPEIWKSDVRKWKSSMRVYSRNVLSRPYTSRMDLSCSASMLVMLI